MCLAVERHRRGFFSKVAIVTDSLFYSRILWLKVIDDDIFTRYSLKTCARGFGNDGLKQELCLSTKSETESKKCGITHCKNKYTRRERLKQKRII